MGGFIGAELAIQFPARVERLSLVSAAGLTIEYQRDERILAVLRRVERTLALYGGWLATRSGPLVRRPRSRRALMRSSPSTPTSSPPRSSPSRSRARASRASSTRSTR